MSSVADTEPLLSDAIRATVVSLATTSSAPKIVSELRREAVRVNIATGDVLDAPPTDPVYVINIDHSVAVEQAARFVDWAITPELHAGLLCVVENAGPRDCEALLATGFDDVVAVPFSARELVARVRALHRRVLSKGSVNGRLRFGELTLDLYGRDLWIDGKTISLTSIELAVVRELIKARGRPLSRSELLDLVWGDEELEISPRAVDNVILRLRRKLPRPELIETVRSVGFRIAGTARP
ncbi:MAG: DNA-binding response regulator [Kofleriaceae bacterium]